MSSSSSDSVFAPPTSTATGPVTGAKLSDESEDSKEPALEEWKQQIRQKMEEQEEKLDRLAEQQSRLAEQKALLAEAKSLLAAEESRRRLLIEHGIPAIMPLPTSGRITRFRPSAKTLVQDGGPGGTHTHEPLSEPVVIKPFGLLQDVTLNGIDFSYIWSLADDGPLRWDGESDIQIYVKRVLLDCIRTANLRLRTYSEIALSMGHSYNINGFRLLHTDARGDIPVGVIKVQIPMEYDSPSSYYSSYSNRTSSSSASSLLSTLPNVSRQIPEPLDQRLGEVYNHMRKIRDDHGVRHVFGIVTSYTYWRIVWLPDTDKAAARTNRRSQKDDKESEDEEELKEDPKRSLQRVEVRDG